MAILLSSCHQNSPSSSLRESIAIYDRLIKKTDADSISLLYAIDGNLGNAAHGRDSIRKFLLKFSDFKVLEQKSIIDSINEDGNMGYVAGTYHQLTMVPLPKDSTRKYDTVSINGKFNSEWIKSKEGWRIKVMETENK